MATFSLIFLIGLRNECRPHSSFSPGSKVSFLAGFELSIVVVEALLATSQHEGLALYHDLVVSVV